ncbi:MAG: hypothetical protein KME10_27030 [Plectolyngbya sp. WJT66-NPBG17]|nr:hypothetical protein [Plectolyngbya sp. WJT66-NPBG17]MBW4528818.1 hypothetical protein [Phormidium tanganyikae FI6-MK23]
MINLPRHITFETADDLSFGQPLCGATGNVVLGRLMPSQSDNHHPKQGGIRLTVAASV